MADLDNLQIPPPKSWDDFENLCCDLWKEIWQDPDAQRYGRKGQNQEGIDIFGNSDGAMEAVQCKEKDILLNKNLQSVEIKEIIKKAKEFESDKKIKLSKLIIATTAPRDVNIIKEVAAYSDENTKKGSFSIAIWFWEAIVHEIEKYPQLLDRYSKILGISISCIEKNLGQIIENQNIAQDQAEALLPKMKTIITEQISGPESENHAKIDIAKKLLEENKAEDALEIFQEIKDKDWGNSSDKIKYRLLTNLAVCHSELGEERECARLFIDALQYNPEDDRALANAALGNLILGDRKIAKDLSEKAIKKNQFSEQGFSALVQSSPDDLEKTIKLAPEVVKQKVSFLYAVGFVLRNKHDFSGCIDWMQKAIDTDNKDLPELKAYLAEAILQDLVNRRKDFYYSELPTTERKQASRAKDLLTQAWSKIEKSSLRFKRARWLENRSLARKIEGDLEGALKDLDMAIELEPNEPSRLIRRAILSFEKGNDDEAISYLDKVPTGSTPVESLLLKSEILDFQGETEEAIHLLSGITRQDAGAQYSHVRDLLFGCLLKQQDIEGAERTLQEIRKEHPKRINTYIFSSQLALAKGDKDEAIKILKEAEKYIGENRIDMSFLADQFYKLGLFDEASSLYENFVDSNGNSQLTRRLCECLYRGSNRMKALVLCGKIRRKHGPIKYAVEMEAAVYEEIGDLNSAVSALASYLNKYPDDLKTKIDYAGLLYRQRKMKRLDSVLDQMPIIDEIPHDLQFKFASLLFVRGKIDKGLKLIYHARKQYFDEPNVHSKYIGLFLGFIKDDYFKNDNVEVDTAVKLEQANGSNTWHIITDESPDLRLREIASEHNIAKLSLGKKCGDRINIGDSFAPQNAIIKEIKSKYLYALHQSMEMISSKSIESVNIKSIDMQDNKTKKFDPSIFFKVLDEKAKASKKITDLYNGQQITIGAFANLAGLDDVSMSMSLIRGHEVNAIVSSGDIKETIKATETLRNPLPILVVDLFTLLNISEAGIKDLVVSNCGPLGITQSLMDDLTEFLAEHKGQKSKGSMIVGKKNGRYINQEISEEDVSGQVREVSDLLDWTKKNCVIVAHPKSLEMENAKRIELQKILGKTYFDTIMASCEDGRLLFSDDLILRRLAESDDDIVTHTIWSQPLLLSLSGHGKISQEEYSSAILGLILNNNYLVNFNDSVIFAAAEKSHWEPKGEYLRITALLGDERYGLESIISVAVNFIYRLLEENISQEKKDILILLLLKQLLSRKGAKELIINFVAHRFKSLPSEQSKVQSLITSLG